jgi:hypothetical protein
MPSLSFSYKMWTPSTKRNEVLNTAHKACKRIKIRIQATARSSKTRHCCVSQHRQQSKTKKRCHRCSTRTRTPDLHKQKANKTTPQKPTHAADTLVSFPSGGVCRFGRSSSQQDSINPLLFRPTMGESDHARHHQASCARNRRLNLTKSFPAPGFFIFFG